MTTRQLLSTARPLVHIPTSPLFSSHTHRHACKLRPPQREGPHPPTQKYTNQARPARPNVDQNANPAEANAPQRCSPPVCSRGQAPTTGWLHACVRVPPTPPGRRRHQRASLAPPLAPLMGGMLSSLSAHFAASRARASDMTAETRSRRDRVSVERRASRRSRTSWFRSWVGGRGGGGSRMSRGRT